MATYTITTAVNIDSLATKTGSDTYNIDGGYLTVDQHSRYGVNQTTSAAMGNIVMSAALGGTIEFNSTLVRLIPYNTGTGTVPALNTTISQGSASGKLLGVYSALNVAPTAAAAAMPATGFILIRQWNSVTYTTGALTGISASATGADRAGWLEIVGVDALTATVNRLNTFKVRGDYFDFLGVTTDGARATTYQLPTNGSAVVYVPGVEVETGTGTGVYEFYPCAGTLTAVSTNVGTDAVRGKVCWITATTGLVRFGHDGTNLTGGFVPPSGRKIRVPNIFFTCCTAAAPTANVLPNATLATRYEFATTGGGVIDIDKASMNWYCNFAQPFSVALTNFNTFSAVLLSECASPIAWSNVGVGQEAANTQIALTMSLNFAGGTMTNCTWSRAAQAATGTYVTSWADCSGFTCNNERTFSLVKAANATTGSMTLTRVSSTTWNTPILGGGRVLKVTCTNVAFNNTIYYDHPATTTPTAIPMFLFDMSANCLNITYDGLTFGGLVMVQPYSGILQIGAAGCKNIKLRNLGTAAAPLDMGGDYVDATWSRSLTVMTITRAAHGLKVGDLIAVNVVSDVTPKAVTTTTATLWTVATAPTANTFTVTVTDAGAASGTMSYYPTVANQLVSFNTGSAANSVKIQRCYTPHLRANLFTGDNSTKGLTCESVWGTDWNGQFMPYLNAIMRGILATPSLSVQTSVYGTHFFDYYITGIPTNLAAVAWTRATTVATITSNAHGLKTGDQIVVNVTSDAAAIVKGVKTITATTSNTFTFTCLNAGGASGTLTFAPVNGRVAIQMNETTADTSTQVSLFSAAFTSAGGLYMPNLLDQVDFTFPTNLLGHSSFPIVEPVLAGGGALTNFDITYSLNDGVTYSNLSYPRAGGGGASASTTVTMTSTTGVAVNDYVFGTGIAPQARVTSITNATTIVVDTANTAAVSGILRFNQLPNVTIANPATGTPLRIRMLTTTANTAAVTSFYFSTTSTATARAATYPMDTVAASLYLYGMEVGTEVRVYRTADDIEIAGIESTASTTFTYNYTWSGTDTNVYIVVFSMTAQPIRYTNQVLGQFGLSIPVFPVIDRQYANPT